MPESKTVVFVVGATAAGKTDLAIELAQNYGTEIISADSRQVYKEMQVGTAVPTQAQLNLVPHHFIQSHSVFSPINAGGFETEAMAKLTDVFTRKNVAVVCGGSGLYLNALAFGLDDIGAAPVEIRQEIQAIYAQEGIFALQKLLQTHDPAYYQQVDLQNHARIARALEYCVYYKKPFSAARTRTKKQRAFAQVWVGAHQPRPQLYQRINQRMDEMLAQGLLAEVERLHPHQHLQPLQTVGYTEFFDFLDQKIPFAQAVELAKQHTRNFAKRQLTWFGKNDQIEWFDPKEIAKILLFIEKKC